MKCFVDEGFPFDRELFFANFMEEKDPFKADICIFISTYRHDVGMNKSIMIQCEPPIAEHRQWLYGCHDAFHTVYTFNPDPTKDNEFPVSFNNRYAFWPYPARQDLMRHRDRDTIKNRMVYYAGSRYAFENVPDKHGAFNLYPVRSAIVDYVRKHHDRCTVFGSGWGQQTGPDWTGGPPGDWRQRKLEEIEFCDADFVFCLENCCIRNYISEKIWDGLLSDRAVFYLGCPNVADHIPREAFVYLNEYVDFTARTIDYEGIVERIKSFSDTEYQLLIKAAREFREGFNADEIYREERKILTEHIMSRLM